jgi:hypothetical protein
MNVTYNGQSLRGEVEHVEVLVPMTDEWLADDAVLRPVVRSAVQFAIEPRWVISERGTRHLIRLLMNNQLRSRCGRWFDVPEHFAEPEAGSRCRICDPHAAIS